MGVSLCDGESDPLPVQEELGVSLGEDDGTTLSVTLTVFVDESEDAPLTEPDKDAVPVADSESV